MRRGLSAVLLLLPLASASRAEVVISSIKWQVALQAKDQKSSFKDVESWVHPPPQGHDSRPRAVVTLTNRGTLPEGATVLRYAFSAHLVKTEEGGEGTWAIPFVVEDRRIPQAIPANSAKDVTVNVNRPALDAYLKRIYKSGYWLDALRIQVELEPRPGENFKERTKDSTLPVTWKKGGASEP